MKITAVTLEHTNPSMGPHEVVVTLSLSRSDAHAEAFDRLLTETRVNGVASLEDVLKAHQDQDAALLNAVSAAADDRPLNEGATISNLQFSLDSGAEVELSDLRLYRLSGAYPDFAGYLLQHGLRSEMSSSSESPWARSETPLVGDAPISVDPQPESEISLED